MSLIVFRRFSVDSRLGLRWKDHEKLGKEAKYQMPRCRKEKVFALWFLSSYLIWSNSLPGTNICPAKALFKMIFLFPRWDMLVPWRVMFLYLFNVLLIYSLPGLPKPCNMDLLSIHFHEGIRDPCNWPFGKSILLRCYPKWNSHMFTTVLFLGVRPKTSQAMSSSTWIFPLKKAPIPVTTLKEQVVKLQDQLSGREEERQKALKREVQAERALRGSPSGVAWKLKTHPKLPTLETETSGGFFLPIPGNGSHIPAKRKWKTHRLKYANFFGGYVSFVEFYVFFMFNKAEKQPGGLLLSFFWLMWYFFEKLNFLPNFFSGWWVGLELG